jgi:hypothetical protein
MRYGLKFVRAKDLDPPNQKSVFTFNYVFKEQHFISGAIIPTYAVIGLHFYQSVNLFCNYYIKRISNRCTHCRLFKKEVQ